MLRRLVGMLLLAGSFLTCSLAAANNCPAFYLDGKAPEIQNAKMATGTSELCYGVFGVMHSGVTLTPLWSAEHLVAANIVSAQHLSRENSFHPEERLAPGHRAELSDYARSGYDRGHMSPNGDMPDRATQYDSFTLANMVPQDPINNRHLWAGIEGSVRKLAKREGELYVITGPVFRGTQLKQVGRVLVPTQLFKVLYSPRQRAGAAYLVENSATAVPQTMSIAQIEALVGINLMPSLSGQQKQVMLKLPRVQTRH